MGEQMNCEELWKRIEAHGMPCNIRLLCDYIKTYTGPGTEYMPLWSISAEDSFIKLEEIKRGKGNVLWGRLKSGDGWIALNEVQICE